MTDIEISKKLNKYNYSIRFSQIVAPFGVGSMIDFADQTLMLASTEYWSLTTTINDERLQDSLGVNCFKLPPDIEAGGVPMVRFPEWYFCPKCKRFQSIKKWQAEYKPSKRANDDFMTIPKCSNCNIILVPAGIITICENGHISDFPWAKWVHRMSNKKTTCTNHNLKFKNSKSVLGLEGLKLECTSCNAEASMGKAFNKNIFEELGEDFLCEGYKPWEGKKEKCTLYPRTAQRSGLNVYFPKVISSIVIPPYSDDVNNLIENSEKFKNLTSLMEDEDTFEFTTKEILLEKFVSKIANDIRQSEDVVSDILKRKFGEKDDAKTYLTKEEYRVEEYNALLGKVLKEYKNSRDFKLSEPSIEEYNIPELSKITLVQRLREVKALIGFTRVNPPENNVLVENNSDSNKFVSIKKEDIDWYPAQETRGEGIFIEFNNKLIDKWVKENPEIESRAKKLEERYNKKNKGEYYRRITPKFILIHTIAHLLIKELSFECGYSSTSLRERVFCNTEDNIKEMSGILIYTASGDCEGTLGGLVRQGRADLLPRTLKNCIKKASWCSGDPVCIESQAQGRDGLNLVACHSCALVSETSCEEFNVLLDRTFVVGNLDKSVKGFFDNYLKTEK